MCGLLEKCARHLILFVGFGKVQQIDKQFLMIHYYAFPVLILLWILSSKLQYWFSYVVLYSSEGKQEN